MKVVNKYILLWAWGMLGILLGGMAGCSDGDGHFPDWKGREMVLHAFSEKLAGEGSFADSVFFAKGDAPGKYTEVWKAYVKADGSAGLAEPKYYPSDNSRVFLHGFAPEGKREGDGQMAYRINGQQDIMVTEEHSGCLTDMFWLESKSFGFVHLLSQLRFRFCCDEAGAEKGWKLTRLFAEGVQCEAMLSLADNSLSFSGEKEAVEAGIEAISLGLLWGDVSGMVMIQPGVPVFLTAEVEDRAGNLTRFEHLPVTFHEEGGYPLAGTSYLISVTLRAAGGYSLSAQVAKWEKGNNGTGIID